MIQVSENLKQLNNMGKTIVIITHDLELILKICDYIVHLKNALYKEYWLDETKAINLTTFFTQQVTHSKIV